MGDVDLDAGEVGDSGVCGNGDLGVEVVGGVRVGFVCMRLDCAVLCECEVICAICREGKDASCSSRGDRHGPVFPISCLDFRKNPLSDECGIRLSHAVLGGFQGHGEHADDGCDGKRYDSKCDDDLHQGKCGKMFLDRGGVGRLGVAFCLRHARNSKHTDIECGTSRVAGEGDDLVSTVFLLVDDKRLIRSALALCQGDAESIGCAG